MSYALKTTGPYAIQAMPFVDGFVDLGSTADPVAGKSLIMCKTAGIVNVTFDGGNDTDTSMEEGQVRSLPHGCTVTITSGTYDFA